jgi:hypothetical protein
MQNHITPAQPSPSLSALEPPSGSLSRASSLPVPLRDDLRPAAPFSAVSSHDDVHTGKTWARTVDDDPWLPLVLTLDGGGIRGYSSLLILQRLMKEVAVWENYFEQLEKPAGQRQVFREDQLRPCLYFDFMYGTSTGGLIATMLGRLRMTVPVCLDIYKEVGQELFGKRRSSIPLATRYDHEPLEAAVRRIVRNHCPVHSTDGCDGADWNPWAAELDDLDPDDDEPYDPHSNNRICQTICLTAVHNQNITNAYLLRTYNHRYNLDTPLFVTRYNEGAERLRVWEVTRATSAAPFFFKSFVPRVDGSPSAAAKEFKDGGIRENNPSVTAWSEFVSLYGAARDAPALLLSVGTGRPNASRDGFASAWPGPLGRLALVKKAAETFALVRNMLVKYTEGESRHLDMARLAHGQATWYKRLNVGPGLEGMRLDSWESGEEVDPVTRARRAVPGGKTLRRLEEATRAYLEREKADASLMEYAPPGEMLKQVAEKMVRHRRARERTAAVDPVRWETFCGKRLARRRKPAAESSESNDAEKKLPSVDGREVPAEMGAVEA